MKVAIYARYSSENQRDASIADQFRVCREFAQRQGWHIVPPLNHPKARPWRTILPSNLFTASSLSTIATIVRYPR